MAQEIFPGVRLVTLGTRDSQIKGYKSVAMEDVVFQPKGAIPLGDVMVDDMVCTVTEGELQVAAGDMEFTAKEGDVWSCGKGSTKESCHEQRNRGRRHAGDQPESCVKHSGGATLPLFR